MKILIVKCRFFIKSNPGKKDYKLHSLNKYFTQSLVNVPAPMPKRYIISRVF